ncbi:MAG: hypothetical protein FWG62_06880 [Proteobacteria bacterium]|nr:hypothetical protein [Pseudomonadota bacterium]
MSKSKASGQPTNPGPPLPPSSRPVVLDFDASVLPLCPDEIRIPLADWQEAIRFGCTRRRYAELEAHLQGLMMPEHGCVFTGSGDYHHLSLYLLKSLAQSKSLAPASLDVVVCDNHPDNMRYPFGLHCGSWVRHAAALAWVRQIHVIGITSPDITLAHAWENYLWPFVQKKLFYWSVGRRAAWLGLLGRSEYNQSFGSAGELMAAFAPVVRASDCLYLSIDKDVLSPAVVRTTWDQGVFGLEHLDALIQGCAGKLVGADITGDVSTYAYEGRFKRLLSRLDGQPDKPVKPALRQAQQVVNAHLLTLLDGALLPRRTDPVGENPQ